MTFSMFHQILKECVDVQTDVESRLCMKKLLEVLCALQTPNVPAQFALDALTNALNTLHRGPLESKSGLPKEKYMKYMQRELNNFLSNLKLNKLNNKLNKKNIGSAHKCHLLQVSTAPPFSIEQAEENDKQKTPEATDDNEQTTDENEPPSDQEDNDENEETDDEASIDNHAEVEAPGDANVGSVTEQANRILHMLRSEGFIPTPERLHTDT
ncbi:hypothetical protein CYMTET_35625 [Cymbomonas tetramitiformis]|uniref:Uncharacterized protein n=1 Tax=Cymbomonas tetramitiformis TaxID=36881 RepID=A0AAE0KNN4_9CHLO|nr:hypothetical protein CYMTET_35625 [Cymbomonas tetramitiformis]